MVGSKRESVRLIFSLTRTIDPESEVRRKGGSPINVHRKHNHCKSGHSICLKHVCCYFSLIQELIRYFSDRQEKVSMGHVKDVEIRCINVSGIKNTEYTLNHLQFLYNSRISFLYLTLLGPNPLFGRTSFSGMFEVLLSEPACQDQPPIFFVYIFISIM